MNQTFEQHLLSYNFAQALLSLRLEQGLLAGDVVLTPERQEALLRAIEDYGQSVFWDATE